MHKPLGRLCNLLFMYAELVKVKFLLFFELFIKGFCL